MANAKLEFCGLTFKNPIVGASLETTSSPDLIQHDLILVSDDGSLAGGYDRIRWKGVYLRPALRSELRDWKPLRT